MAGSSPGIDRALEMEPVADQFLRQPASERCSLEETLEAMLRLFSQAS